MLISEMWKKGGFILKCSPLKQPVWDPLHAKTRLQNAPAWAAVFLDRAFDFFPFVVFLKNVAII